MYEELIAQLRGRPPLYAPGTSPFWEDEHISAQMLAAHLDPQIDAASRKHEFIDASAEWIGGLAAPAAGKRLLDLGCGPGLYAQRFAQNGFAVTGIDLSPRSIRYARQQAQNAALEIDYQCGSYLELDFGGQYDVVTLIYCDFGVLSPRNRAVLLGKIRAALKPGGMFIMDVFSRRALETRREGQLVQYSESGFWADEPHVCIQRTYLYPQTGNYVEQYVVITQEDSRVYNIWNQAYDEKSLTQELKKAGFSEVRLYGDASGEPLRADGDTICAVAR